MRMIPETLTEAVTEAPILDKRSRSREWQAFRRNPLAVAGVFGLVFLILFSFLGPLIYHGSTTTPHLLTTLQPPSARFPLGTDSLGRDNLARMMVGGQLSLEVGFAAAFMATFIGVVYGLISGMATKWIDVILMRVVDIFIAIPSLFLLLFVDSVFHPSAALLVIVIGSLSWFAMARMVRSEVLTLKRRDYVEAARAVGASNWRIMFRELLPNVMGVVVVNATFQVADAILTVAGLSFLGLGLPPPTPNWGEMLSSSMSYMFQNAWWLIYPPGIAILIVELSVNFIGDALRQAFDPRLRKA
jgi:peptide/nickel transport system permease protein